MQQYSTLEVLAMYEKDRTLKFECIEHEVLSSLAGKKIGEDRERLAWLNSNGRSTAFVLTGMVLKAKWVKLRAKVDVLTALRAFNEGHTIICVIGSSEIVYDGKFSAPGHLNILRDVNEDPISDLELLEGTWYIK